MIAWLSNFVLISAALLDVNGYHTGSENPSKANTAIIWSIKLREDANTNEGAWNHQHLDTVAALIAADVNAENLGQVGELRGYYLLKANHRNYQPTENLILNHKRVLWHHKQFLLKRVKRRPPPKSKRSSSRVLNFQDPLYKEQWHLRNLYGLDCNVTGVWAHNVTGKGVVVAIVDDGVEWRHPDLIENYCKEGSFDLNSNDVDPTPFYDVEEENKHGTRCAGEVAAVPNSVCGVGIAFESKFSGIRLLDGPTTDATEATAFNKHMDVNDVYSCSWGPEDDGKAIDGPHALGKLALQHGVVAGRRGFGSVYIVASGNGGDVGDNCNYDGYANSIYTITIGAIDEFGRKPPYSEECTSMIASSLSSGVQGARSVVTTDWSPPHKNKSGQCTKSHTGTSAATPLASGMVALMLQVRPCLTWRDIQHIIVMTAVKVDRATEWTRNDAGFTHSDSHGFGLLNAWRLVTAASVWSPVPWLTSFSPYTDDEKNREIPCCSQKPLILKVRIAKEECEKSMISSLEHINFHVNLKHHSRGKLSFSLHCPSGLISKIPPRRKDLSDEGLDWTFSTVKCWGENPVGMYTLKIIDTSRKLPEGVSPGTLVDWKLTIYGSRLTASDLAKRREGVLSSSSGTHLQESGNSCPPGENLNFDVTAALSDSTIKLVAMISCFLAFWAIYYMIEIAFCDPDGLKKVSTSTEALQQSSQTFFNSTFSQSDETVPEPRFDNLPDRSCDESPKCNP